MTTIICSTRRFKTHILEQYMLMYSPYIYHIVNMLLHYCERLIAQILSCYLGTKCRSKFAYDMKNVQHL